MPNRRSEKSWLKINNKKGGKRDISAYLADRRGEERSGAKSRNTRAERKKRNQKEGRLASTNLGQIQKPSNIPGIVSKRRKTQ